MCVRVFSVRLNWGAYTKYGGLHSMGWEHRLKAKWSKPTEDQHSSFCNITSCQHSSYCSHVLPAMTDCTFTNLPSHTLFLLGICHSKEPNLFIAGESCLLAKQLTELQPFVANPTSPPLPYIPVFCTKLVHVHLDHLSISNCFNSSLFLFKAL